jgi:hypothetical protein
MFIAISGSGVMAGRREVRKMKISKKHWKDARDKWRKMPVILAKKKKVHYLLVDTIDQYCGYCLAIQEVHPHFSQNHCSRKCSLAKKKICLAGGSIRYPIWKLRKLILKSSEDFDKMIALCKKIADAINDDGREWGYIK